MPFNKSYRKYKRKQRRRPYMRRRYNVRMTAGKVKRIISAELKFRDLGVGPVPIPAITGHIAHVTNVAQGDLATERQGNWIKPVTFMGTITLEGNNAQIQPTSQFRVGCLVWKENQDVDALTLPKFVQDTIAPHQQFNIQAKGSFKILWSRVGIVSNDFNNPQFQKVLRFYVKPSMKVLYDAALFRKYHIFMFAYSDRAAADDPPDYSFDVRLRFTDS